MNWTDFANQDFTSHSVCEGDYQNLFRFWNSVPNILAYMTRTLANLPPAPPYYLPYTHTRKMGESARAFRYPSQVGVWGGRLPSFWGGSKSVKIGICGGERGRKIRIKINKRTFRKIGETLVRVNIFGRIVGGGVKWLVDWEGGSKFW